MSLNINFKQCHPSNYRSYRKDKIKWLVMHYTGNKGDTASGNAAYFSRTKNLGASAHYFVDEKEIWQSIPESACAWHCGSETGRYYNSARNDNSIGIEMCSDWRNGEYVITAATMDKAVELAKDIMKRHNIPIERVCMHYDVTRKQCPLPWVKHYDEWNKFIKKLKEKDMTKGEVTQIAEQVYDKNNVVYETLNDVPEWAKPTIKKLVDKGYLEGDGRGLNLSSDLVRTLVINDRSGIYGE